MTLRADGEPSGESPAGAPGPERVLAVVVLYRRAWEAAAPMPVLRRWLADGCDGAAAPALQQVLIWDNSPEPIGPPPPAASGIVRVSDSANGGTRAAYIGAAAHAERIGAQWVLLLDQDTALPDGFVAALRAALAAAATVGAAALVPRVLHEGRLVSPAVITALGRVVPRRLDAGSQPAGIPTAIASGALIRTADLQRLSSSPAEFWLDYLDHWLFCRFHADGRAVAAIDIDVEHHLSVQDPASMMADRFRNVLRAEQRFMVQLPVPARLLHRPRLVARGLRLALKAPSLSWIALRAAFARNA